MRATQVWSRETDRKILVGLGCLALASGVGFLLPEPVEGLRLLNVFIASVVLVFVWGVFRILQPMQYGRVWLKGELFAVLSTWIVLMIAVGIWFAHLERTAARDWVKECSLLFVHPTL